MRSALLSSLQAFLMSAVLLFSIVIQPMSAIAAPALPNCVNSDCNCSDFDSQEASQIVLDAFEGDPFRLDRDKDGVACESLPKASANPTTTILASDFNAHGSPDGATSFSGISWSSNGVDSSKIATSLSPDAFVQQSGAPQNKDRLAVARNIDRAGPWTITISVEPTKDLVLQDMTFDYQFISNGGVNQLNAHPDSGVVEVSILDTNLSTLSTVQIGPLGTNDRASNLGTDIVADFEDVALTHNELYFLSFTASSNSTVGNNMSVDNFSVNGSIS